MPDKSEGEQLKIDNNQESYPNQTGVSVAVPASSSLIIGTAENDRLAKNELIPVMIQQDNPSKLNKSKENDKKNLNIDTKEEFKGVNEQEFTQATCIKESPNQKKEYANVYSKDSVELSRNSILKLDSNQKNGLLEIKNPLQTNELKLSASQNLNDSSSKEKEKSIANNKETIIEEVKIQNTSENSSNEVKNLNKISSLRNENLIASSEQNRKTNNVYQQFKSNVKYQETFHTCETINLFQSPIIHSRMISNSTNLHFELQAMHSQNRKSLDFSLIKNKMPSDFSKNYEIRTEYHTDDYEEDKEIENDESSVSMKSYDENLFFKRRE